jgi:hypothetical protein
MSQMKVRSTIGVILVALAAAGCGGGGDETPAKVTKEVDAAPGHVAPELESQLPDRLNGVSLETESFSGDVWIATNGMRDYLDHHKWLSALGADSGDLTAAWAKGDSVAIIAIRIVGADPVRLLDGFAAALDKKRIHTKEATVAGRRVLLIFSIPEVDTRHIYTSGDVLYFIPPTEEKDDATELLAQLR